MNEVDSEFVKKCIRAVGKIAIRYEKSVEKCMGIISKQVKEIRTAAQHAETIVDELLIVIIYWFRPSKTFSESILQNTTMMECSKISLPCLSSPLSQLLRRLQFGFLESMLNKFMLFQWTTLKNGSRTFKQKKESSNSKFSAPLSRFSSNTLMSSKPWLVISWQLLPKMFRTLM